MSDTAVPLKQTVWPLLSLMLKRRPSGDLYLFLLCQTLAVAIVTGILLFTDRIENAIRVESAGMLAADWVLHSSRPPQPQWIKRAQTLDLKQVESVRLASMLFYREQLEMGDIRAVSADYPLRGELKATSLADDTELGASQIVQAPALGEVWLDKKMAQLLAADIGAWVEVGDRSLRFSHVLLETPGSGIPSMGFAGRALMRIEDLPSTGLIQPGSRLAYEWMVAGGSTAITDLDNWIRPQVSAHERVERSEEGNEH